MIRSRAPQKSAGAYRTISEVAAELDVPQHVLRFWETKFPEIRPLKRGGGRRYYRPEDVDLLRRVQSLLHTEGYTIKGVQRLLSDGVSVPASEIEADPAPEVEVPAPLPLFERAPPAPAPTPSGDGTRPDLSAILDELRAIRRLADKPNGG